MKTDVCREKRVWWGVVVAAAVLGACGPVLEEEPRGQEALGTAEQGALSGVAVGLNTGNIFQDVAQQLSTHSEQAFCEFSGLGAQWIRIEADVPGTSTATYQLVVQKAHEAGLQVLVVVPARYCGPDNDMDQIDAFTTAYVNRLNELATTVFTGAAQADAYEIGDDVNVKDQECPDEVNRYRVGSNAFAWLLRRAWEWKTSNGRTELMISGGLRNTYTTEPFWNPFFASGAFTAYPGERPFDYFGIHPYNPNHLDQRCIATGASTCFTGWKNNVISGLKNVALRMNIATGTSGTKLWATEFGFQMAACTNNCVLNQLQMTAGMQAAGDAFVSSAVTPVALWAGYRDSEDEYFGLRGEWAGAVYPVRTTVWNKFRAIAGGTGSTYTEACWAQGIYRPMNFESGDARGTTQSGEWAHASYKGECPSSERVMGLSRSTTNHWARVALCYKDPLDSGRYLHTGCYPRNIEQGSNRGTTATGDWDPGNYLGECAADEYVAGVAQTPSHQLTTILCCPATVIGAACEARFFSSGDDRETTDSGEWDASGHKGECGVGRYVAGVSRTPTGEPSAILCCTQ